MRLLRHSLGENNLHQVIPVTFYAGVHGIASKDDALLFAYHGPPVLRGARAASGVWP